MDLDKTVKNSFLLTSNAATADTVIWIDTDYVENYPPWDKVMRFKEDKGIVGFLNHLHQLVVDIARVFPYNESIQDMLGQHIFEQLKLPPKQFKI